MANNMFIQWLIEAWKRATSKSPLFFKWWTILSGFLIALTGLPAVIDTLLPMLHIQFPEAWLGLKNSIISWISTGVFFMSLFPAKAEITSVAPNGIPNSQIDPKKLPFSANAEIKQAIKEGKPKEVDPWVPPTGPTTDLGSPPRVN